MSSSMRVLLTVLICVGILVAWHYLFEPKQPPRPPQNQPGTTQPDRTPSREVERERKAERKGAASRPAERGPSEEGPLAESVEGEQSVLRAPYAVATFTTTGAAIRHWVLTDPRFQEITDGKLQQVDLVHTQPEKGAWPLTVTFPSSDFVVPPDAKFSLEKKTDKSVRYVWRSRTIQLSKTYVLDSARPIVWLTVDIQNLSPKALRGRMEASVFAQQPKNQGTTSFTNPYPAIRKVSCYANGELFQRSAGAIKGEESGCTAAGCGMGEGEVSKTGEVPWVGSDDRYFLMAMVPQDRTEERRCDIRLEGDTLVQGSLRYPEVTLQPGKSRTYSFLVFAGPKDLGLLDSVKGPGGTDSHLGESVEFGWLAVLCRPMLWLMKIFYRATGNWGIAIILLTIVVKLLTLYWTQKSMRSMREMQRLKPKIDALKEKFKDDKERFNQEMMALYKIHKVNPLGGCLPMLIQMPIWFALYRTLGNAVDLYRSHFAGWIKDLTAPDPYYVLPIAMGISMYAQQAITPQPMEGAQAKMMKYFMPGLFTVMMLALPSGLTLYIFVNTVLTMIHQWYMNKKDPPLDPRGAAAATGGKEPARETPERRLRQKRRRKAR